MKSSGRSPKLLRWQVSYIKRAARLRKSLTNGALAKRFGVSEATITSYLANAQLHGCREDFDATVQKRREIRKQRRAAWLE